MPKIISPERLGSTLNQVLSDFNNLSQAKANKGIRIAVVKTWGDIIKMTPVGDEFGGSARGNWFIDTKPTNRVGGKSKNKSANFVASKTAKINLLKSKLFMFNNLPYIRVLEYGGYSTKNASSENSKVTPKGYSKKAPKGMVRLNLLKWRNNLKKSFARLG